MNMQANAHDLRRSLTPPSREAVAKALANSVTEIAKEFPQPRRSSEFEPDRLILEAAALLTDSLTRSLIGSLIAVQEGEIEAARTGDTDDLRNALFDLAAAAKEMAEAA